MRHSHWLQFTRSVCLTLSLTLAAAAGGAEPTIHEVVKTSVDNKRVYKTELAGFGIIKYAYRDSRTDGGILVGFDVAICKHWDTVAIGAVRPVFLTPTGEVTGNAAGSMYPAKNHPVIRTVRLVAKPGYAVGAVNLRAGLQLHGMSVTFMPIVGTTLDPKGAYRSQWVGDLNGANDPKTLSGKGSPIIGVFGNVDNTKVIAIGLLFAQPKEMDEDEADDPPAKVEPPADASAASATPIVVPDPVSDSDSQSRWLPLGIAVFFVLGVGTLLFVAVRVISAASSSAPPTPAPKPRPPSTTPPTAKSPAGSPSVGDDGIPTVPVWSGDPP